MHKRLQIKVLVVLIIGLVTGYLTFQYLTDIREEVTVFVPIDDIETRTVLTPQLFEAKPMTYADQIRFFPKAITDSSHIVDMVSARMIEKGEILVLSDKMVLDVVTDQAMRNGEIYDPALIPNDMRLSVVNVKHRGGPVSKLVKDLFVDVIYTSTDQVAGGLFSSNVIQHARVYEVEKLEDGTANVYLLVTPEEAIKLTLGKNHGIVDLVLNPTLGVSVERPPLTIEEMVGYRFVEVQEGE